MDDGAHRGGRKTQAVLNAARELFYARGFEAVGIEEIATKAKVSRTTVYADFSNKASLFQAVIAADARGIAHTATQVSTTEPTADFEGRLAQFAESYLSLISRPDVIALERVLAREGRANPTLVQGFLASGPAIVRRDLETLLTAGVTEGALQPGLNVTIAAQDVIALLLGPLLLADRYGDAAPPPPGAHRARAQHVARLLCDAYRSR